MLGTVCCGKKLMVVIMSHDFSQPGHGFEVLEQVETILS